jgi:exosortase F-associated protein
MNKFVKYIIIFVLVCFLFLIRAFEERLFYDPLIVYFQNDYLYAKIPDINLWKLVVDLLFRYTLNSLITLGIIYLAFNRKRYVKFSGFFLMSAFIVLLLIFVFLVRSEFQHGYLFPFYIRRFIVHPLFLLILVPAFYYHSKSSRRKN